MSLHLLIDFIYLHWYRNRSNMLCDQRCQCTLQGLTVIITIVVTTLSFCKFYTSKHVPGAGARLYVAIKGGLLQHVPSTAAIIGFVSCASCIWGTIDEECLALLLQAPAKLRDSGEAKAA